MRSATSAPGRLFLTLAVVASMASPTFLRAQTQDLPAAPPTTASPADEFEKQYADVKKHLESLGGKIRKSAKEIESLTSGEQAHKEIDTLQKLIAETLGLVADNADVARLGQRVSEYAKTKQKQFDTDTKFSPEERAWLRKEWQTVGAQTENAIRELNGARDKLAQMLRSVQTRSDYMVELKSLNNAQKMLEVVKNLALELQSASDAMENFSKAARPPRAGT